MAGDGTANPNTLLRAVPYSRGWLETAGPSRHQVSN